MQGARVLGACWIAWLLVVSSAQAQPAPEASPTPAAASTATGASTAAPAAPRPAGKPAPAPRARESADPAMDGATFAVRLRNLQQRVDQLKERIRRSHARLSLLSDTVVQGGTAGSRAAIRFENKLSGPFELTRALILLDGAVQYNKSNRSGALGKQKVIPLFDGSLPPGDHTIQVLLNLEGRGTVFSYLDEFRFEVRASRTFKAVEGKTARIRIVAYDKGGVTTRLEDRPTMRFFVKVMPGLVSSPWRSAAK